MTPQFKRPHITEQVVEYFTQCITDGRWPAGLVLPPEPELMRQLGVSRTVIRECVRILSSRGMLDVRQGSGTTVAALDDWNVTEPLAILVRADKASLLNWLEVRTALELCTAQLAAERATASDRKVLRGLLSTGGAAVAGQLAFVEADVALHLAIADAAHNPQLRLILKPLVAPLRRQLSSTVRVPKYVEAANREHALLIDRVVEGDPEGARAAMLLHLRRVAEEIADLRSVQAPPADSA